MQDSFIFYASFHESMSELTNEDYGALMRAISDYALHDKAAELSGVSKMLFVLIKPQIDANNARRNGYLYDIENGKKGGRPERFTQEEKLQIALDNHSGVLVCDIADKYKCSSSLIYKVINEVSDTELENYINYLHLHKPSLHLHKPEITFTQTINDNVNDNVNVNVNVNENVKESADKPPPSKPRFVKPTLQEIREYCCERKNNIDAESFYNFYESKNWLIGKNKMSDWRAAVITWEKRSNQPRGSPKTKNDMNKDWVESLDEIPF